MQNLQYNDINDLMSDFTTKLAIEHFNSVKTTKNAIDILKHNFNNEYNKIISQDHSLLTNFELFNCITTGLSRRDIKDSVKVIMGTSWTQQFSLAVELNYKNAIIEFEIRTKYTIEVNLIRKIETDIYDQINYISKMIMKNDKHTEKLSKKSRKTFKKNINVLINKCIENIKINDIKISNILTNKHCQNINELYNKLADIDEYGRIILYMCGNQYTNEDVQLIKKLFKQTSKFDVDLNYILKYNTSTIGNFII